MRHTWRYTIIMFMGMTLMLHADIDAQIDAIKNASVKERFKLMNAFKRELIKMKEEERIKAITKLSEKSNKAHAKKALDELKQNAKHRHIQKHLETHHIDEDNIVSQVTDQEGGESDD